MRRESREHSGEADAEIPSDTGTEQAPPAVSRKRKAASGRRLHRRISSPSKDDDDGREYDAASKDDGPACQACRRKKAKCSRRQPCSQCIKNETDCIYDDSKNKPGVRVGAVEQLNQRLGMTTLSLSLFVVLSTYICIYPQDEDADSRPVTLENMFLGQGLVWQQVWRHLEALGDQSSSVLPSSLDSSSIRSLHESTEHLKETLSSMGDKERSSSTEKDGSSSRSAKRQRLTNGLAASDTHSHDTLPNDLVDSLVEIYFERIHPWIPMLHVHRFRQQMADPLRRQEVTTTLDAITSLCARFSDDSRLGSPEQKDAIVKRHRDAVILRSMESFSVSNLQPLIICAFNTISSGRGPSAWSIVGSMTRTAEQLQLSVEDTDKPPPGAASNGIISRIAFLRPPRDWCEEEERRRVFWNIFLMDRFCSISTGWNLSLTSADARRRLPCEGGLWQAAEPLKTPTPYFGLSDQFSSNDTPLPNARPDTQDQNCLGGFAYCIEATESLSQVTSFFLQQPKEGASAHDIQVWLMNFKQIDLRLVQWKVFLPERWREACAVNQDGNMDPNLTLAHITHNTAVVLLHQSFAYPALELQSAPVRLPTQSSSETCLAAAVEVATIAEQFLKNSKFLASHQFAFCLFLCGRMLLTHSSYYQLPLAASFESIVESLGEISTRWCGRATTTNTSAETKPRNADLASKFASRLTEARDLGPTTFDIRQAAYSDESQPSLGTDVRRVPGTVIGDVLQRTGNQPLASGSSAGDMPAPPNWQGHDQTLPFQSETSPDSISLAFPPLPQAFRDPSSAHQGQAARSPMMAMHQGFYPFGGEQQPVSADHHALADMNQGTQGFEDINTYLDGTFLPDQRISMYSQLESLERQP